MDQDNIDDTTPPENPTESNPDEPTAAHFREAARLAAARVRAALAQKPEDPVTPLEATPPESEVFEEEALKQARSLSGHAPEPAAEPSKSATPTPTPTPTPKSKRSELIPEIDERLELGARMLRAFESQIQRLERSARTAEEAHAAIGSVPDPSTMESTVTGFEQRFTESIEQAEGAMKNLQDAAENSNSTAEALAGSLETANTVKTLLETTLRTLSDEADARSADVKRTVAQAEATLEVMNQQLKRAEEIEHAVGARLNRAQEAAEQIERASCATLDSIREHVAHELTAIGAALLEQSPATVTTPGTTDPPLIEVESISQQRGQASADPIEAASAGQQISRGTLSIDETVSKRQTDGG